MEFPSRLRGLKWGSTSSSLCHPVLLALEPNSRPRRLQPASLMGMSQELEEWWTRGLYDKSADSIICTSLISQLGDQIRIQKCAHKGAIWGPTLLGPQQDPLGPECLADHPKKAIGACWGLIGAPGRLLGHRVPPALSVIQDVSCP